MPWAGGVFTRTDGVRTGSTVCQQAQAASVNDTAPLCDAREQDLANGLNNCLTSDGSKTPTADIGWGNHKITNLASGSSTNDAVNYGQLAGLIPSGTVMSFFQAAAPTGWTQVNIYNDAIMRVVGSTGGGHNTSGQSLSSATCSGTVNGHSITQAELPNCNFTVIDPTHLHSVPIANTGPAAGSGGADVGSGLNTGAAATGIVVNSGGSGTVHGHTFTGGNLSLNYVDMILASKN